jgi:hypothetical protein
MEPSVTISFDSSFQRMRVPSGWNEVDTVDSKLLVVYLKSRAKFASSPIWTEHMLTSWQGIR